MLKMDVIIVKLCYNKNHVRVTWKFLGGGGVIKDPLGMEIPKGWGMQTKNLPWEGYGYFLEPHNMSYDQNEDQEQHSLAIKTTGIGIGLLGTLGYWVCVKEQPFSHLGDHYLEFCTNDQCIVCVFVCLKAVASAQRHGTAVETSQKCTLILMGNSLFLLWLIVNVFIPICQ